MRLLLAPLRCSATDPRLQVMRGLQENMWDEEGPYGRRPSNKTFVEWVELAGSLPLHVPSV